MCRLWPLLRVTSLHNCDAHAVGRVHLRSGPNRYRQQSSYGNFLLLLVVPCDNVCVRQLAAKYVQRTAHSDVHSALASCCHTLQILLQANQQAR